jgi:hypothetical protein
MNSSCARSVRRSTPRLCLASSARRTPPTSRPSTKSRTPPLKTVVSETNAFTGLEDDLGIGGAARDPRWDLGKRLVPRRHDNAIELDVFPPPRPSPDSILHVIKPVDFAAGGYLAAEDVSMEFSFNPPAPPTTSISASLLPDVQTR